MSPTVNNFVHDLVAMAKAMDDLPKVEARVAELETQAEANRQTIQDREASILSLKAEIEALHEKVRASEVARDEAQFRMLELEDLRGGMGRVLAAISGEVEGFRKVLDPSYQDESGLKTDLQSMRLELAAHKDALNILQATIDVQAAELTNLKNPVPPVLFVQPPSHPSETSTTAGEASTGFGSEQGQGAADPTTAPTQSSTDHGPTDVQPAESTSTDPVPPTAPADGTPPEAGGELEPVKYANENDRLRQVPTLAWWQWYDRQVDDGLRQAGTAFHDE